MARGSSLKVLGPEAETLRFAKRIDSLVAYYYLKYGHISSQVIDQCFSVRGIAGGGPDKDVIVYGNNGNIVRARTVNQQRLVKLYDKGRPALRAVGPAGLGQDLYGRSAGGSCAEGAAGAADHPRARPGGGREAGFPARGT